MSWAEVKKGINSNLSVPLDKYLGVQNVPIGITSSTITLPPNSSLDLVNCQGKGYVHSLIANMQLALTTGKNITVQIIIDDEVLAYGTYTSSGTNQRAIYIGLIPLNNVTYMNQIALIYYNQGANNGNRWKTPKTINTVSMTDYANLCTEVNSNLGSGYNVGSFIEQPIFFNHSFILRVSTNDDSNVVISGYNYNSITLI